MIRRLSRKEHPVVDFARFIKLHDPNLSPEEQESSIDRFRTACLLKLVHFAERFHLNTLFKPSI